MSFGYDAGGNRTWYTDGRGNATSYSVNTMGLPESVVEASTAAHPAGADRTWTASYDAAGNAVSMVAPGGVRRARSFDAAGRLTMEEGTGAEAPTSTRELGYDLAGRPVSMSSGLPDGDQGGANTYEFNDRGLLLRADGPSGPQRSTYDADGLVTQRTDAAGTADFTYTKGRLATVTDPVTRTLHTLGWNTAGEVESIGYGSGRVRSFGYDPYGRLGSDVLKNSAGATVASIGYGYDAEHRVTRKQSTGLAGAGTYDYLYDQLGRLTSWTIGTQETAYEWDDASNRTKVTVTGGSSPGSKESSYDQRNRLITDTSPAGTTHYSYSPRGSLLSKTNGSTGQAEAFTFDAFDRLIKLADRDYAYDALDRPVQAGTARMRYAGFGSDMASDGTQYYGRGPGGELLSLAHGVDTPDTPAVKRLVLSDRRDDVVAGFDPADPALASGVPDSRSYDPFGQATSNRGLGSSYRVGFQGDWTDPRSGQVQMSARWYEPGTGTFTSRDTMSYPAGVPASMPNTYAYAAGNPVTLNDPTGHSPCEEDPSVLAGPGNPMIRAGGDIGCVEPDPSEDEKNKCLFGGCEEDPNNNNNNDNDNDDEGNENDYEEPDHDDQSSSAKRSKPKRPVCDAACQWRKKVEKRDDAKERWDEFYGEHHIPLPPGIDDPTCPRGNAMCGGVPGKPSPVISDQQGIDNQGLADKINGQAGTSGDRANGDVTENSKRSFFDRLADGLPGAGAVDPWGDLYRSNPELAMELAHLSLDVYGLIPGVGAVFDLANAAWYAHDGDHTNAALSGASAIPGAGDLLGAGKITTKLGRLGAKHGDDLVDIATSCKVVGKTNSFTGETPVLMADGTTKPIKAVWIGEMVLATDPATGESGPRRVKDTIRGHGPKKLVDMTINGGVVSATEGHPFWLPAKRMWVEARDLAAGARLLRPDGLTVTIEAVRHRTQTISVYNLTIEGIHTYFVIAGKTPVLSHNCNKPISLPAWRNVSIDIGHIMDAHTASGDIYKASGRKDKFYDYMSSIDIEKTVRQAYRNSSMAGRSQGGDRVLLRGHANGMTIEMWLNKTAREIETAYPIGR